MPLQLLQDLPSDWIRNLVDAFEEGRLQKHPQCRFVNASGECCVVGALAGARSREELVGGAIWRKFRGSQLEELSRCFEARRLSGQEVYEAALLVLAARSVTAPSAVPA